MRKEGKTYSEICNELTIAKSTLSLWLRAVELSKPQEQRITEKRTQAAARGGKARHDTRIKEIEYSNIAGIESIGKLTPRELWLIGIALHWAEGSKQNERSLSAGIVFSNSDYRMVQVFLLWLGLFKVLDEDIIFELYVHASRKEEIELFKGWWSERLAVPIENLSRIYLKQGNPQTRRTNTEDLYHGLIRIKVKKSTAMNRNIQGLIHGIATQLGSGVIGNTSAFEAEDSRIVP
ncbi:MAG: hypothetical protein JWM39_516 [Parcubacteria group bacterium]|nr:hypothetical protein [Parcubacteria group bacterium]